MNDFTNTEAVPEMPIYLLFNLMLLNAELWKVRYFLCKFLYKCNILSYLK